MFRRGWRKLRRKIKYGYQRKFVIMENGDWHTVHSLLMVPGDEIQLNVDPDVLVRKVRIVYGVDGNIFINTTSQKLWTAEYAATDGADEVVA